MKGEILMNDKKKVLIIKPGYSEVLVSEVGRTTSLGDVLRSTTLLHLFKDAHVTWLVGEKAMPLLAGNPLIARILPCDWISALQLQEERFDIVINLEKDGGFCALADKIKASRHFGFRFNPETGQADAYTGSERILAICSDVENKTTNMHVYEKLLFEMVGAQWRNERPILGRLTYVEEKFDVGFNHSVGPKWPNKAWPAEYWKELERLLSANKNSISWQQGEGFVAEYIDWVRSVRLLVTNDSLGLHIAHALGKKVVVLFGPTVAEEVYLDPARSVKLCSEPRPDCAPCLSSICTKPNRSCMYGIYPLRVFQEIGRLLNDRR